MFKRLLLFLSMTMFIASSGLAQITNPVAVNFKVKKHLAARNVVGAPLVSAYTPADPDTLRLFGIDGTVIDTFFSDGSYRAIVKLVISSFSASGRLDETYTVTDTLRHGVEVKLPYNDSLGIADSSLYLVLDTLTGVSPGDIFYTGIVPAPWRVELDSIHFDSEFNLYVTDTSLNKVNGELKVLADTTSRLFVREPRLFEPWE